MAEAFAVAGLVSSIITFIEFGTKIVQRIDQFRSKSNDRPVVFRDLSVQLSLLLVDLERTRKRIKTDKVDLYTQSAVKAVVESCQSQITVRA